MKTTILILQFAIFSVIFFSAEYLHAQCDTFNITSENEECNPQVEGIIVKDGAEYLLRSYYYGGDTICKLELAKIDDCGNIMEEITLPDMGFSILRTNSLILGYDLGTRLTETADGNYLWGISSIMMGAYSNNTEEIGLVKFNLEGEILWSKVLETPEHERLQEIIGTPDGGSIHIGSRNNSTLAEKLDENGNLEWTQTYEQSSVIHIEAASDGSFLIDGVSRLFNIDASGNILWEKTGLGNLIGQYDDKYLCYKYSSNENPNGALILYDNEFNELWSNNYFFFENFYVKMMYPIIQNDTAVILTIESLENEGWLSIMSFRSIDLNTGQPITTRRYPTFDNPHYLAKKGQVALDGGYLFGGHIFKGISGGKAWHIKFKENGEFCETSPCDDQVTNIELVSTKNTKVALFPNPTNKSFKFRCDENSYGETFYYRLYNEVGKLVQENTFTTISDGVEIDVSTLPQGVYLFQISNPKNGDHFAGKLMVE